jgi:hypothetical protein
MLLLKKQSRRIIDIARGTKASKKKNDTDWNRSIVIPPNIEKDD